ncbi:putative potassium transporter 12 [Camellia lanceoleosa]|uniref:Potassium transporter 12 n=1 Tax=Camellia lanceoleosa TaxID=1840588 RepID=A0ACC0F235_9ERIC|nr:putative potassium transporter 12 [Camellia lanceoleosa]
MFPKFMRWDIGALVTRIRGLDFSAPGKFQVRTDRLRSFEYERDILATDEHEVGRRDDRVTDAVVRCGDGLGRVAHEVGDDMKVKTKDVHSTVRDAVSDVASLTELEKALKSMTDMEVRNKANEGTISKLEDEVVSLKSKMETQAVNIVGGFGCVMKVKDDEIRKIENENKELRQTISMLEDQLADHQVHTVTQAYQKNDFGDISAIAKKVGREHAKKTLTHKCKGGELEKSTVNDTVIDVDTVGVPATKWSGFELNNQFRVWKLMTFEENEKITKAYERNGDGAVMWANVESGVSVYFTDVKSLVIDAYAETLVTEQAHVYAGDALSDKSYFFSSICMWVDGSEVDSESPPWSLLDENESRESSDGYGSVRRRLVNKLKRVDSFDVEAMEIAGFQDHHAKDKDHVPVIKQLFSA